MSETNPVLELAALQRAINEGGIMGALAMLNRRTVHRFTGVYKFEGTDLHNLYLYDREDPEVEPMPPQPVAHSYCSLVQATDRPFSVANSVDDERVRHHPKREVLASYCGVPLHYLDGSQYGSLCHFDYRPFLFTDLDVAFLEASAPLIMQFLVPNQ